MYVYIYIMYIYIYIYIYILHVSFAKALMFLWCIVKGYIQ